jgi:hypothetical protein
MQPPHLSSFKDLKKAPKLIVNKARAFEFWERSESSRASSNSSFFKILRQNKATVIVALIAILIVYFRLQEATCVKLILLSQLSLIKLLVTLSIRFKHDRRLNRDTKAEDDPFKVLGLPRGSNASQVITSVECTLLLCTICLVVFRATAYLSSGEGSLQAAFPRVSPRQEP